MYFKPGSLFAGGAGGASLRMGNVSQDWKKVLQWAMWLSRGGDFLTGNSMCKGPESRIILLCWRIWAFALSEIVAIAKFWREKWHDLTWVLIYSSISLRIDCRGHRQRQLEHLRSWHSFILSWRVPRRDKRRSSASGCTPKRRQQDFLMCRICGGRGKLQGFQT